MAVTGVFTADFSNFDKAVQQSEANLGKLDQAGGKVSRSLALMTAEQEKLLNSIGAAGGRVGVLAEGADTTNTAMTGLAATYGQFDKVLGAAGLRIAPQVAGLLEIGTAATTSAVSLGVFGTAAAVAGTAITAWNLGRKISEWLGLDAAIESATFSLMGWNTASEEAALSAQDTINRVKDLTGETMSLGNARKYLADQAQIASDKDINWRGVLADAHREVRNLSAAQQEAITIAQEAGATTEQITNKYGVSALALEVLADRQRVAGESAKAHTAELKEQELAANKLNAQYAQLMSDTKNANQLAIMNADATKLQIERDNALAVSKKGITDALGAMATAQGAEIKFQQQYTEEQAKLDAENQKVIDSIDGMAAAHTEAGDAAEASTLATVGGYQAVAQQVEITSDGVRGWLDLMRATNAANALLSQNSLFTTGSMLENQSRIGGAFSPIPGFASGVQNFAGGLARVHGGEVLANLAPGTSVFPKGQGFGNVQMSNVFNLVDSESNLARRVADLIMRNVRAGTQLGTA
jgi:hypothetical protein